jgi:hypothetical protein
VLKRWNTAGDNTLEPLQGEIFMLVAGEPQRVLTIHE